MTGGSGGTNRSRGPTPGFPGLGDWWRFAIESAHRNNFDLNAVIAEKRVAIRRVREAREQMQRIFSKEPGS